MRNLRCRLHAACYMLHAKSVKPEVCSVKCKSGFTLIEMLIVIVIIAGLAALVIPMIGSVGDKAGDAGDVANQAALTRQVMIFAQLNGGTHPNHLDSLFEYPGPAPLQPSGLYKELYVILEGMGQPTWEPMLKKFEAVDAKDSSMIGHALNMIGISDVFDHDPDEDVYPNDSTDTDEIIEANGQPRSLIVSMAILNTTDVVDEEAIPEPTPGSNDKLDNTRVQEIYEHFNLNVNTNPIKPKDGTDRVAVFGFGKRNTMIGAINGGVQDTPFSTSFDSNEYYSRYLLLYLLPPVESKTGTRARFLGVLSGKGKLMSEAHRLFKSE